MVAAAAVRAVSVFAAPEETTLSVSTPAIVFVPAVWPFKVSVAVSVEPLTAAAANVNVEFWFVDVVTFKRRY